MVSGNMTTEAMTTALGTVGSLVTTATGIIADNPILMVIFCGSILGIGFRIIHQAKNF